MTRVRIKIGVSCKPVELPTHQPALGDPTCCRPGLEARNSKPVSPTGRDNCTSLSNHQLFTTPKTNGKQMTIDASGVFWPCFLSQSTTSGQQASVGATLHGKHCTTCDPPFPGAPGVGWGRSGMLMCLGMCVLDASWCYAARGDLLRDTKDGNPAAWPFCGHLWQTNDSNDQNVRRHCRGRQAAANLQQRLQSLQRLCFLGGTPDILTCS